MRVPKRPFFFQFKNEKRKTNFMYLNHLFSKINMKMKNKIEYIYIYINMYLLYKIVLLLYTILLFLMTWSL